MTTGIALIFVPIIIFIQLTQGDEGVDRFMNKLSVFLPEILENIFG